MNDPQHAVSPGAPESGAEAADRIGMRRIYYDVTHLRHNARRDISSGIRRVDFEFARHFFGHRANTAAIQYRIGGPALLQDESPIRSIVARGQGPGGDPGAPAPREHAVAALLDDLRHPPARAAAHHMVHDLVSFSRFVALPFGASLAGIAKNAIYLNVAQHAMRYGFFFSWLKARPDVRGVFFVHDLMPLDYPEFWRRGYSEQFRKGVENIAAVGSAFIVSSEAVRERLERELRSRGRQGLPILSLPFPAFGESGPRARPAVAATGRDPEPYFVMVGTLEPRKNHLLVLNIWRKLAEAGGPVPKLVLVGRRGWENEQVVDMLERCKQIRDHVVEAASVSDARMRQLVGEARALLYPSFDEGFGLPLAEALQAGTPVIASDIPVLHETAQERALFLDPLDGPGWTSAVLALADRDSPLARHARSLAAQYRPGDPEAYFRNIERFLDGL